MQEIMCQGKYVFDQLKDQSDVYVMFVVTFSIMCVLLHRCIFSVKGLNAVQFLAFSILKFYECYSAFPHKFISDQKS